MWCIARLILVAFSVWKDKQTLNYNLLGAIGVFVLFEHLVHMLIQAYYLLTQTYNALFGSIELLVSCS